MNPSIQHIRLDQPARYEIKVQGRLREDWEEAFGGMQVQTASAGADLTVTTLIGRVADQPALHGILNHLRDLGLVLLLVRCIEFDPAL
jgi:hypothetical protein